MTKEDSLHRIKKIIRLYEDGEILYDEVINSIYAHLVIAVQSVDYKASVEARKNELDSLWVRYLLRHIRPKEV